MKYCQILFAAMLHVKCRGTYYPNTSETVKRFLVPNDKVKWSATFPGYLPTDYTAEHIKQGQPWADTNSQRLQANWNSIDGVVNRASYTGIYEVRNGYPINPMGRTGLKGRGCLGRWGPNHAADPIVSRWKRSASGQIVVDPSNNNRPVMQFVAILRGDCGEWALPGGMVDPGEVVTKTVQREFLEEALNSAGPQQVERIKNFFKAGGMEVYRGYVDDPRNTDNAWMETVALSFHDDSGQVFGNVTLKAGDDAVGVKWQDLSSEVNLYASHIHFLEKTAVLLMCRWQC